MILMQNIIDKDKTLMTIMFDKSVMKHLRCKVNDYVVVLQSNFKYNYFLLVKADTGYRIKRYPTKKKMWQVNVMYKFNYVPEFDTTPCTYYLKKNNSIRIILGKQHD